MPSILHLWYGQGPTGFSGSAVDPDRRPQAVARLVGTTPLLPSERIRLVRQALAFERTLLDRLSFAQVLVYGYPHTDSSRQWNAWRTVPTTPYVVSWLAEWLSGQTFPADGPWTHRRDIANAFRFLAQEILDYEPLPVESVPALARWLLTSEPVQDLSGRVWSVPGLRTVLTFPECPPDVLAAAAMHTDSAVRAAAAGNPACPEEALVAAALLDMHAREAKDA